jgi:hypothetical protein
MSGVLHPVGPEPARTYWIRRGILFAVVLLLALGVILSVANLTKAAVATAPPPVIAAAPGDTSASPKPSGLGTTPTAPTSASPGVPSSGASSPGGVPASSSPQASGAYPSVSGSAPPSSGSGSGSAPSGGAPSNGASSPARASARPSPTVVGTPDCRPSDLRVTLTGDRTLSPGQKNRFALSLINGGTQTCLVSVTDKNFELKIYSGKDRIWSSRDCSSVLTDFDKKLGSQSDVRWAMAWNGKRSVAGKSCQVGAEKPRAGTYWATAQLAGAEPVQLRMIVS